MTHRDKLLAHFAKWRSITPMEAWRDLWVFRLSARVFELRADGHSIETERLSVATGGGGIATVARYHYRGAPGG
jgi:hypothetical protein